ncbi:hypothetical protein [uncultured Roseibium sp.]|uniref:hypothetical protein n=1 Tax=uncultured Roseibium sp. TaxID=1936171 RepID=UPI00321699E3
MNEHVDPLGSAILQLREGSAGLTRPIVIENFPFGTMLDEGDICEMLRALRDHPQRELLLRVFIGSRQCFQSERQVFDAPPEGDSGLEAWGTQMFGPERWGCTIYRAEQLNPQLAERVAGPWKTLKAGTAEENCSQEIFVFAGNYGKTPFGVHEDKEQGAAVHFHIGPGLKRMYMWTQEAFEAATGGTSTFYDLPAIAHTAEVYEIPAGSAFLLPADYFHIGETEDYSAGIVVTNVRLPEARLRDMAVSRFLDCLEPDGPSGELGEEDLSRTLGEMIGTGGRIREAERVSNAGFTPCPLEIGQTPEPSANTRFRRRTAFPLVTQDDAISGNSGELSLYARGNRLTLPESLLLQELADDLNTLQTMTWGDMLSRLETEFEPDAAAFICRFLLDTRAIEETAHEEHADD